MASRVCILHILAVVIAVSCAYDIQLSSPELRQFFAKYDKSLPPSEFNGGPVTVNVGMYYNQIELIRAPGRSPRLDLVMYMRMAWTDSRFKEIAKGKKITLEEGSWKYAWIPDIFTRNSVYTALFQEPISHTLMRVNPDGRIWFVQKIKETLACPNSPASSTKFTCGHLHESFKYTTGDVIISWLNQPVDIDKDVKLDGYSIEDTILYDCTKNYTAGTFPCLENRFVLSKDD